MALSAVLLIVGLPAAMVVLAGCGGDALDGTFDGTYEGVVLGVHAQVVLDEEGENLSGKVLYSGGEAGITGTVRDGVASGHVHDPTTGMALPFRATLEDDDATLAWVYLVPNPMTGQTQEVPLSLRRAGASQEIGASGGASRAGIDPQLVGRWYREVGGGGVTGNVVTTRITNTLFPDGTFTYGGGQSLIGLHPTPGGPGSTGMTDPSGATRGQWKVEAGVLFMRIQGMEPWIPLGRYQVSGNDLVLYTADGGKQLWSRQ